MASQEKLTFVLEAVDKTKGALTSVQGNLDAVQSKVKSFEPAFKKMALVGTATFAAIAGVVAKSVQGYAEAERAQRQLENAVINVSRGTMAQVQAINTLSSALEKKSGIDADALKIGAAQLSTFGLQSKSVADLTKSLADFTVNQNGVNASADNYVSSANTIAKALNGQFGLLEKTGVRFTEAQKALIQFGSESEKVSAIQEGLAQNLRETTDTVGNGLDGQLARVKRSFESIGDGITKALLPAIDRITTAISPVIEKFSAWADENPKLLSNIVLIAGALAGITAAAGIIGLVLPSIIGGFKLFASAIGMVSKAFAILAANPVILIIAAIVAVIAGLAYLIIKNWEAISTFFVNLWEGIKNAFSSAIDWIVGAITGFGMAIWEGIQQVFFFIVGLFATFLDMIMPGWEEKLQALWAMITGVWTRIKESAVLIWNAIKEFFVNMVTQLTQPYIDAFNALKDFFISLWEDIKAIFNEAIEGIKEKLQPLIDFIENLINKLAQIGTAVGGFKDKLKGGVTSFFEKISGRGKEVTGVNDAIISPGGKIITTHPDDYLIATKTPETLFGQKAATAGGPTINIVLTGNSFMGKEDVAEQIGDRLIKILQKQMKL